jgi:hypothetical protein
MNVVTNDAAAILAASDPHAVFGDDVVIGFRHLARIWHPDHNASPDAPAVFGKLVKLRDRALGREPDEVLVLPGGTLAWGAADVTLRSDAGDCVITGRVIESLRSVSPDLAKRVPGIISMDPGVVVFGRPPDAVPLAAVMRRHQPVPQVHAAWIASRLYELVMIVSTKRDLVQGAILPESLMVLVKDHGIVPLDWRFAMAVGTDWKRAPAALVGNVPRNKRATWAFDLAAIHRVILILLGDPSGVGNVLLPRTRGGLGHDAHAAGTLSPAFLDWFRDIPRDIPAPPDMIDFYTRYRKMLEKVFGKSRYHKLEM